ncbi:uncharacterized protein LOC144108707 isoform X8 [Amblyomma americanum]
MFALVRFVEDDKDKRYVISVADIENFEPKNELDFDNTKTYDAYWQDEDEDNSGIYVVQILKLAATKEEMEREMRVKRVHVPPIRMSEVDNVTECGVPAAARKKSLKQQEKAKQQNQITSKKQQYEDVLKRHVSHSLQKNAAIPGHSSIGRKASKKRKPQILDDSTESEDESVVSSRELKNAVKEAKYWKQRYRLEQEHTASLKRELDFLKRKVELQLSSFQQTLDEVAKRQQDLCADALPVVAPSILPNGAVEASRRDPTAARGAATEQAAAAEKDVGGAASVVPTPAGPSEEAPASSCFTADAPRSAELEASVLDDAQDFTLTSGGLAPMDVAESQETLAGPSQQPGDWQAHHNRNLWMSLKARRLWQAHHNRNLWMSLKARRLWQAHHNRNLWMSLKARRLWQAHHNRHLWMSLKARKLYQAHHNRHLWMWPQCWTFSQGHLKPFNLHQNFRLCQPPQSLLGRHE